MQCAEYIHNLLVQWNRLLLWHSWWHHPMETFSGYWPFVQGIHQSLVNSSHKGQWCRALMFSLICAWINGRVKNLWGWWFEMPSCSLWCHCNVIGTNFWSLVINIFYNILMPQYLANIFQYNILKGNVWILINILLILLFEDTNEWNKSKNCMASPPDLLGISELNQTAKHFGKW